MRELTPSLRINMGQRNENRVRVFVYGTLKDGFGNHEYFLAGNPGVEYLGRCYITGDYRMYTNGAFPMVTKGDDSSRSAHIVGEVYEIDEPTLDALDGLEGHPDWYCREKVDTPWKKAWVYLMPERGQFPAGSHVESGCFSMSPEESEWINGSEIKTAV
jgi:gamma-glutamylcyclotransferase (GGCT)/AIG2-like uncharacterized protein YtfP